MNMTRREFMGVAAVSAAALVVPPVLARPKRNVKADKRFLRQSDVEESWEYAKKHNTIVSVERPPIQVYCLGTDDNPVTSLDIQSAMHWIKQNASGDRIIGGHALYPGSVRLLGFRIPIYYENNPWPSGNPQYIHCRYFVVERPGHGYLEVRIGSDNRPAQIEDLRDIAQSLYESLNDPELSIVTHHNFEMKWFQIGYPDTYNGEVLRAFVMPHNYPGVPTDREIANVRGRRHVAARLQSGEYICHERDGIVAVTKSRFVAVTKSR